MILIVSTFKISFCLKVLTLLMFPSTENISSLRAVKVLEKRAEKVISRMEHLQ